MNSPNICREFKRLVLWTWDTLATAAAVGMPRNEESITEHLLLELAKHCPLRVKVFPFSKPREAKQGADWEWWFHSWPLGIGMRVQAKKINFHTWCFNSLKFRPRSGAQIDKLVNAATADQLIPLYCLYGFESGKYRSPNLYNDHLQACSIIRAEEVAAMGSKAGLRLMPRSRPWHRLVCNGDCCGIKDLHDIAGWLGQLPAGDASNTSLTAVRELPDYVKDLVLETKRYPPIEWENIVADETGRGAKKRGFITIRVGN
jgi:hypothetical protein